MLSDLRVGFGNAQGSGGDREARHMLSEEICGHPMETRHRSPVVEYVEAPVVSIDRKVAR